jgi:hypothetical protein
MTELVNYGELMDAEEARLKPAATTSTDYGAMMDSEAQFQRQRLAASLTHAKETAPDTYAKTVAGAKSLGVPPAAVEGAPEDAQQKLIYQQADALLKSSPRLAEKMSSPEFAKLAHDDTEQLGLIEGVKNGFARGWRSLKQTFPATQFRANADVIRRVDEFDEGKPGREIDDPYGLRYMSSAQRATLRAQAVELAGEQAGDIAGLEGEKRGIPQDPVVQAAQQAKTFSEFWYFFRQKPLDYIAAVGAESFPTSAPGLVAGGVAGKLAGLPAAASAVGTGSFATDYASTIMSALQQAGIDTNNKEALLTAVQDKGLMERVAQQAFTHAVGVATFDAISGGVAGQPLVKTAVRGGMRKLGREAMNMAVQAPVQGGWARSARPSAALWRARASTPATLWPSSSASSPARPVRCCLCPPAGSRSTYRAQRKQRTTRSCCSSSANSRRPPSSRSATRPPSPTSCRRRPRTAR